MTPALRRSFVLLAITAGAMATLLGLLPAAGHDQLWFLLMACRWLHGASLYGPEVFDSNPPLIVWLSAVCVKAAALSHSEPAFIAKLLLVLLGGGLAWFDLGLLRQVWRPLIRGERAALLFAYLVLFFVLPARDLGQRDALAVLFALPYVIASARQTSSSVSKTSQITLASFAAVGFCLKPQDALIGVAVELTFLARAYRLTPGLSAALGQVVRRIELPILLAAGGLYVLAIHRFTPLYLTLALPVLRNTYWAIGGLALPALFSQALELTILLAVTLITLVLTRPVAPLSSTLLIAGLGAFVAYLLQGTGWYYQQLPALGLVGAALALHMLDLQHRRPLHPPHWTVPALAALCVLTIVLTTHFTGYPFTRSRAFALTSPDPAFFSALTPGTSVAILTTSVDEAMMPVEQFHLTWAQRTNNLWLLPAILFTESPGSGTSPKSRLSPGSLAQLAALQHRWMVEDLVHWQPALILVERCQDPEIACQILESRHENLLAWFEQDPAFRTQWDRYRFTSRRGRFDAYTRVY